MALGRPAGSHNKNKAFLLSRLQDMYGDDFHPIMKMAENAVTLQKVVDSINGKAFDDKGLLNNEYEDRLGGAAKVAIEAWDKVAAYTEPKLKAIEVSGNADAPLLTKVVREIVRAENQNSADI